MTRRPMSPDRRRLLGRLLDGEGLERDEDAIPAIPRPAGEPLVLPLSPAQERLWFLDQVESGGTGPGTAQYVMAGALRLRGAIDVGALRAAFELMVRRHEALRTGFDTDTTGRGLQVVREPDALRVELPVRDVTAGEVGDLIRQVATRGFDVRRPPLLRGVLLRVRDPAGPVPESVLVLALHHLVADGWSLGVLVEELGTAYAALRTGADPDLPDLPVGYADVAAWQSGRLPAVLDGQLPYWRTRLAGAAPVDLAPRRAEGRTPSHAGGAVPVELPGDLVDRLRDVGAREQATLYMVLAAAFAVVLRRWSGQADVVVGAAVHGRGRTELERLVGFFVNTLPLRLHILGDDPFRAVLRQGRTVCLEAFDHQDVPFDQLVKELRPDRDARGRSPLVRHLFVLHNTPQGRLRMPGVEAELVPVHTGAVKFDLELELAPVPGGGLSGWLEFAADVFDRAAVERLASALRCVLDAVAADPDLPAGALPVMTGPDHATVAERFSGAAAPPFPQRPALMTLFRRAAEAAPNAPAVVVDGGARPLTYGELDARSDRVARCLRGRGVGVEDRVGVYAQRGAELVVALLGVLKAGAAYLPLEPDHPPERLRQIVAEAAPRLVLTGTPAAAEAGRALGADALAVADTERIGDGGALCPAPAGSAIAYVLFTSGSTGRPKGVANTHDGIVNRLLWMQREYGLDRDDRVLHKTPIGFDVSVWELLWPLITGATLVLARPGDHRRPDRLHGVIDRHGITTCHFVPSMCGAFLEAARDPHPSLRRVVCSGEELSAALAERFLAAYPHVRLDNLYGPTEAAIDVSVYPVTATVPHRVPIGRPIRGAELYVLDEALRAQPVGVPGELFIGGVQVARGYLGRPGLTADRFVPHPWRPGARLYATGDRARWRPDGDLEFLGRLDDQMKIRGNRIEPGEIEAALRHHPLVREALVTAHPDAAGTTELTAYLTTDRDGDRDDLSADQVARWQTVFDDLYAEPAGGSADPTFDTRGWIDSFTGEPFTADEMREWVESIVERVPAEPHHSVLEIGCGTGLLLFRLAPRCGSYHATDVSDVVLTGLRTRLHRLGEAAGRVTLSRRAADDFTGIPDGSVDIVLVNSVVQYFPDAGYLLRVLQGAVRAVRPGGVVIVGDVRCRASLPALHTAVRLAGAADETALAELRPVVRRLLEREEELVVDADLFRAFGRHHPEISEVLVLPKPGRRRNELTKFRYDVMLRVGGQKAAPAAESWKWTGLPDLLHRLRDERPRSLVVTGAFDARVRTDLRAAELLESPELEHATVADLRARLAAAATEQAEVDPADLVEAADGLGYRAVPLRGDAGPGSLDLLLAPGDAPLPAAPDTAPAGTDTGPWWARHANDPLGAARRAAITSVLRDHLRARLPDYMVPARFVVLEDWPVGPNGKVDRSALPPPGGARPAAAAVHVPPRTPTEREVAAVWAEFLQVDRVGRDDDFFDLGGHSLLATRVVARLRTVLAVDLRLGHLLRAPTPARLAAVIDHRRDRPAAPIPRVSRDRYRVGPRPRDEPAAGRPGGTG